jgi:hypothetical protein
LETLDPKIAQIAAGERTLHLVIVGPYADRGETHSALSALEEFGIDDVQVLTRLPGEAQRRDEVAHEDPSGPPSGDLASETADPPEASPSLSLSESL